MAEKKTVTDSEGNKVVTTSQEEPAEEKPKKSAARKAYEDEVAKDAEEQEKANAEAWQAFITRS